MPLVIEDYLRIIKSLENKKIETTIKSLENSFILPSNSNSFFWTKANEKDLKDIMFLLNNINDSNYIEYNNKAIEIAENCLEYDIIDNKSIYIYIKAIAYINLEQYKKAFNLLNGINRKYMYSCGMSIYIKYKLSFGEIYYMEKNYLKAFKVLDELKSFKIPAQHKDFIQTNFENKDLFNASKISFENNNFENVYNYSKELLLRDSIKSIDNDLKISALVFMAFYTEHFKINFLTRSTLFNLSRLLGFELDEKNLNDFFDILKNNFISIRKPELTEKEIKYFIAIEKTMANLIVPSNEKLYSTDEEIEYSMNETVNKYKKTFEALAK